MLVVLHFSPAVLLAHFGTLVEQVPGGHVVERVANLIVELDEYLGLDLDPDKLLEHSAALQALLLPQLLKLVHLHLLVEQEAEFNLPLKVVLEAHFILVILHHLPANRQVVDELKTTLLKKCNPTYIHLANLLAETLHLAWLQHLPVHCNLERVEPIPIPRWY